MGVPGEIHPERHQNGVEQFIEMLRFDQRSKLEELLYIDLKVFELRFVRGKRA